MHAVRTAATTHRCYGVCVYTKPRMNGKWFAVAATIDADEDEQRLQSHFIF